MIQQGKFMLFDTPEEFKDWLNKQKITRKIKLIQNHHTWSPAYKHFKGNNHFELLKGMESAHLKRNFSQIAQNITTYPDGKIAICRSLNVAPAGIYGWNTYGICIEHIGNFDKNGDIMNEIHKTTIISLNAILCDYFKLEVNKDTIVYHAWFNLSTGKRDNDNINKKGNYKTCPGVNFFGGNNLINAEKYFYPLIREEINNIKKQTVINEVYKMFKDEANISSWAKDSVKRVNDLGLIKGNDLREFKPQSPITKEELAVIIDRLLKYLNK